MENAASKPEFSRKHKPSVSSMWLPAVAALIIVGGGGFIAGMHYQKGHQPSTAANAETGVQSQFGGGFTRQGMRGGVFGQVTAVSSTSVTVTEMRDNTSKTVNITGSTTITKDGAAASVSDIATGDRVMIQTSTSDSGQATSIVINPTFTGGPGMGSGPGDATTQTN